MTAATGIAAAAEGSSMTAATAVPLCVDLDGTLTPVDTLHESLLSLAKHAPLALVFLPLWWRRGKASLKREVASRAKFDGDRVPVNTALLDWLTAQKAGGRRLILVTAADRSIAQAFGARLGVFDEILSSDGVRNLSSNDKRDALVARFGERGFDYAGNCKADESVWAAARKAIVVGSRRQAERAGRLTEIEQHFAAPRGGPMAWIRAIRVHQWAKNALIFLPALLAHKILKPDVLGHAVTAFVAFSLCASSIYLINDLLDLPSDRRHARKRNRPFAAGVLSARSGLLVSAGLLLVAACLAMLTGAKFALVLGAYYIATWAYTLRLKRAALVDVMALASLYTIRIIAGAAATSIPLSFWLLAFSIFVFLSLAIVKRYTEVADAAQAGNANVHGRGYRAADLPLLLNLGVAAGYCTVVVMALYINSVDSSVLYHHSKPLWLVCPLLLYWISRIWLLTTRGSMPDDPVIFALKDRISLYVLGLIALVVVLSL